MLAEVLMVLPGQEVSLLIDQMIDQRVDQKIGWNSSPSLKIWQGVFDNQRGADYE